MNAYTSGSLSPIEEVIEDAKAGKLFILVDDEDRENEGDLCILAEHADDQAINFMAKYGRGLICLALTKDRTDELGLSLMDRRNESRHQTAFTVSIEAREGVTTGISAADRSHTIRTATNPQATDRDITTPGHIFPLVARDGGTLVRAGHTEAMVDIARAAGSQTPAGVICEIMKDDGTMARLPDLVPFAKEHDLKIGAIADLIAWRRKNEMLVSRVAESILDAEVGGSWRMLIYRNDITHVEHIVLMKGDVMSDEPLLVRMHAVDLMVDLLSEKKQSRSYGELHKAMQIIADEGRGVIVLLRENANTSLSHILARRQSQSGASQKDSGQKDSGQKGAGQDLRDYGVGAQILSDLNVQNMELLSNSQPNIVGLDGYGLRVAGWRSISS